MMDISHITCNIGSSQLRQETPSSDQRFQLFNTNVKSPFIFFVRACSSSVYAAAGSVLPCT
jgi:hypothetical protein